MGDEDTNRSARGARGARGDPDRVRRSHAEARAALRLALAFVVVAAFVGVFTDRSWLALHLFLAGGVVLAISGASLMLTVTWSSAPAPPQPVATLQQLCIAAGAAGVATGRELDAAGLVGTAGAVYLVGLVLLAVLLVVTARRGVVRRFDPAVVAYVLAITAGIAGVTFGATMALGTLSTSRRDAHVTLNLLGLVGLVVAGTLPFFSATVGRSRMSPRATRARLITTVIWLAIALAVAAVALATGAGSVAGGALVAYAVGLGIVLWFLPAPTRRQLQWAGPRLLALAAGACWWAAAVVAAAIAAIDGREVFDGHWVWVLAVAGFGQILWGSLAYLLPMLRGGGHELLGAGFAATRSWIALAAANVAGVALVCDWSAVAAVAVALWVIDTAVRAARVGFGGSTRPGSSTKGEPA